jgi:hypothetical protein
MSKAYAAAVNPAILRILEPEDGIPAQSSNSIRIVVKE